MELINHQYSISIHKLLPLFFLEKWTEIDINFFWYSSGDTLKIPDSVMGITFLAAGTSVPEAVSSVIVAKQGEWRMYYQL